MRIRITKPGIYGNDGEIPVGTEVNVKDEPTGWAGRYEVLSGGDDDGKEAVLNADMGEAEIGTTAESAKTGEVVNQHRAGEAATVEQGGDAKPVYAVKDKGRGWHVVTRNGEEVTRSFRESDLEGFNAMSDEDKAAFVEANKPE